MAFADLSDLEDRLDFDLNDAQQRMAVAALEDASHMARHYSGLDWPDQGAPAIARTIVLNVVARYMRNPDGYTQSRAGDESVSWSDGDGSDRPTLRFTDQEQSILSKLGRPVGFGSIGTYAWTNRPAKPDTLYVAVEGRSSFPMFSGSDPIWGGY